MQLEPALEFKRLFQRTSGTVLASEAESARFPEPVLTG